MGRIVRIGLCTSTDGLPAPVEGLAFIEPTVASLLCPGKDEAAFEAALAGARAAPVPPAAVNCFFPGTLKNVGPDVDAAALDAWVETTCRRARAAGVKTVVFGSGGSRSVPDGFDRDRAAEQLTENLRRYGPIAAEHGVTIVLEPLNSHDCNFVNSVDAAAEFVRAAGHPNIRLLVDTYHMATDGDPPDAIRRAAGLMAHAHCAEGDGRGPLGAVGEDQRPYFRAMKDAGYDGPVSLECTWRDVASQIAPAVTELRRQWEAA